MNINKKIILSIVLLMGLYTLIYAMGIHLDSSLRAQEASERLTTEPNEVQIYELNNLEEIQTSKEPIAVKIENSFAQGFWFGMGFVLVVVIALLINWAWETIWGG